MTPLEKKEKLKEEFRKRNAERIKNGIPLKDFKDLGITFLPQTFEWFRNNY